MIFGVLGLGSIGSRHAENLKSLGKDMIAFDPSNERLDWARSQGIEVGSTREDVFVKSQAIVICSPNQYHLQDLTDAISTGSHVLVEKPLAHVAEGLKALLDEAHEGNIRIIAGLNLRFHPAVIAAKRLLEEEAIGQPVWAMFQSSHYLPHWRPDQDYRQGYTADPKSGGVLFDIIHEFDLANHLLGPAKTLTAAARNTGAIEIPSEDCADIVLKHASGVHSNLHLDYVSRPTQRVCKIGGTVGNITVDIAKRETTLTDCYGKEVQSQIFDTTTSADDYVEEMKAFVASAEEGAPSPCDGYQALEVLNQVIEARQLCGLPGF